MPILFNLPFLQASSEAHLIKHGVPCSDADIIIEESSVLYFERLRSPKKLFNSIKKQAAIKIFLEAAARDY